MHYNKTTKLEIMILITILGMLITAAAAHFLGN
jgi:multisubunit Na+/H+ antiporter MnhF subunit